VSIVGKEPVIIQALATIVVWAATRYGLNISDEQALQIAGGAFVVLTPFVRQLVTPTAKLEYKVEPTAAEPTTTEGYRPAESPPPPTTLRGSSL
jgi:hypothetical protein